MTKAQALADETIFTKKPYEDEELILYILSSLNKKFSSIVMALETKPEPLVMRDV